MSGIEIENHPFDNWYIPPNATVLIIGTFPTHKDNRAFQFFYPNPGNAFWRILAELFGDYKWQNNEEEPAVKERKQFLDQNGIGLTDMAMNAVRKEGLSSDDNLDVKEKMNIVQLINDNPLIERVILTSRLNAKKKINAMQLFIDHLNDNDIKVHFSKEGRIIKGQFNLDGRTIKIFVPYSPQKRVVNRFTFPLVKDMYFKSFFD